jgi:hypothetical protein
VGFSPSGEFYATAAEVIPVLLLALIFEARLVQLLFGGRGTRGPVGIMVSLTVLGPAEARGEANWSRAIVPLAGLMLGVVFVLGAEALAVVALTVNDPPEVLAILILVGVGVLLLAMLAVFVDSLLRAMLEGSPSSD